MKDLLECCHTDVVICNHFRKSFTALQVPKWEQTSWVHIPHSIQRSENMPSTFIWLSVAFSLICFDYKKTPGQAHQLSAWLVELENGQNGKDKCQGTFITPPNPLSPTLLLSWPQIALTSNSCQIWPTAHIIVFKYFYEKIHTHKHTYTPVLSPHIHFAFKAIFSQFNSVLFIPTAFFLEMVNQLREGTASIYYTDNENQLPTGLLHWTMGGTVPRGFRISKMQQFTNS